MKNKRDALRLLRVTGKDFVATSTWDKDENAIWRCVRAAPLLRWIRKGTAWEEAEAELKKRRLAYAWV